MKKYYSLTEVADVLGVSKETLRRWDNSGKLKATRHPINNYRVYHIDELIKFEQLGFFFEENQSNKVRPLRDYSVVELFAGAGGLALGLEKAGLNCLLLNDIDKWCCETLKYNRPLWNVVNQDISKLSFTHLKNKVDVLTGGFPCQAFSYAGKKLGLNDTRGTLFYDFARALKEIKPYIFLAENVRGLLNHNNGKTLEGILSVFEEIGYKVLEPQLLKAIFFKVPQKRERLIIVGVRNDINLDYSYPFPYNEVFTVKDALKAGKLYDNDVPASNGQKYPKKKFDIMKHVPEGGYWRDLPVELQKEYMMKSFYLGGGKTGMARRMAWNEPCLTLTCSPSQKQTERCHPEETRPFTVREYARIQTFPDDWHFCGSVSQQYKQIGNAVPVNMATELGYSLISFLNKYEETISRNHRSDEFSDLVPSL